VGIVLFLKSTTKVDQETGLCILLFVPLGGRMTTDSAGVADFLDGNGDVGHGTENTERLKY